jgi:digeranylgeranylglycerophospholipid reductase
MTADVDVIIIGAGPAGLIAARELSRSNITYMLVDRESTPGARKPCGGFIPLRAIEEFEIGKIEDQHEVKSIRLKFKAGDPQVVDFDEVVGVNVRREYLSSTILKGVKDDAILRFNTRVRNVSSSHDGCTIALEDCSERVEITSKIVIDASGANPVSQRFVSIRDRPSNSQMGYGIQYHLRREKPFGPINDFFYGSEYSPKGYGWNFPCGNIAVVGTGGLITNVRASRISTEEYLKKLIETVEPLKSELQHAEIIRKESALMPLAGIHEPSFGKRLLLAGDAACHCSPISGEGIYYSMIGGQEAARTSIDCLRKNDFSDEQLSRYEKAWKRRMGSDLKWGLYLQKRFTGTTQGSGGLGGSLLESEKTTKKIAEMLVGMRSVRSTILAVAPSYIRSKLF